MAAFARKYNMANGVPWISVDWDTWEFRDGTSAKADTAQLAMRPEEGVEALRRILSSALPPQVVVSTGDLRARIDQWVTPRSLRGAQKAKDRRPAVFHPRPELENPYMAPRSSLERAIAEIWQETLGVAQVGVIDNFFTDLSGSSFLATQLVSKLRNRFQVELPLRRFFDGPTVAELAVVIDAQRNGEQPTAPAEAVLESFLMPLPMPRRGPILFHPRCSSLLFICGGRHARTAPSDARPPGDASVWR
jgi:acyl carrier protein